jgi:hypothetical protein
MRLLRLDDLIAFYTNARPFFSNRLAIVQQLASK